MRLLKRNTTEFEYLPWEGKESDLNSNGEHTGELHRIYSTPVLYTGNISAPSGKTNIAFFGDDIRYTHTLVMDDPEAAINEFGLIRWKGNIYAIQAVRPSLNVLNIALKRQTAYNIDPYIEPEVEEAEDDEDDGE